MACTNMVPKVISDKHSQFSVTPKGKKFPIEPDFQPHLLVESKALQLVA